MTNGRFPPLPYWKGRSSNGPVITDYLAGMLDVEFQNYSVSGATTGNRNVLPSVFTGLTEVQATGLSWQIGEVIDAGWRSGPGDIIIIWSGSNDLYQVSRADKDMLYRVIAAATSNIETAINRLYYSGGRNFIVATRTPRRTLDSDDDMNGRDFNRALHETVTDIPPRPGLKIRIFDAYAIVSNIMKNPSRYGFADNNGAMCIDVPDCSLERYEDGHEVANRYINWDVVHKTTEIHRLMADEMIPMLMQ